MGDTRKKTRIAVIYIIITVLFAALVSVAAGLYNELHETALDSFDYLESFVGTYDSLLSREHDEETRIRSDLKDIARLTVAAIKKSRQEILPTPYANGAIVEVTAKGIDSPIDLPKEITPEVFSQDNTGTFDTENGTLIYSRIKDHLYYVEMTDLVGTADKVFAAEKKDVANALEDLAAAHKCEYLYINKAGDNSDDYDIYCGTGRFRKYDRLSQLNISKNDMTKVNDSIKEGSHHIIKADGSRFFIRFMKVGDTKAAVLLIPVRAAVNRCIEQAVIFAATLLVIYIVMGSWVLFIYYALEKHTLSMADKDNYHPRSVKNKVRGAVIVGTLLVLITSLFTQSLESVFTETSNGAAIMSSLFHRIDTDKERSDKLWTDSQDRYTAMAERVALLIDKNRGLQNRDWLQEASEIIGAEYLMIFDSEGREVISDAPYKGLILGETETSATYDFRRLLRGVKSISHAEVKDEVIGRKLNMYGIPLHFLAEDNAYGALILATDPKASGKKDFADVNEIAGSMLAEKAVCFAVTPKKGLIRYSSNPSLLGKRASALGLDKSDLREDYMGFIEINGYRHYVTSARHDKLLYYYAIKSSGMLGYDVQYALIVSLLTLALLGILAWLLLKDFREQEYLAYFEEEELSADTQTAFHPTVADLMTSNLFSFGFLNKKASPDERTGSLLLLCIAAVLIPVLIRIYSGSHAVGGEGSVMSYIGQGDWERGINIFAVSSVLAILCQVTLILIVLKFVINLAGRFLGAKGHTVCTLLYNIAFCFLLIAFVLITLEYFGVNTRALVASFGLAGLAASLGAKDFVADIISGITLMTDGSYKVGDTIEIDDFRGTVLKINMRKTTVINWQGTVKTFSNSTILSVINHSLYPYVFILDFALPLDWTIKKAEEVIVKELPGLQEKCPAIMKGPKYLGVTNVELSYGSLFTKVSVQAACKFSDRYKVTCFLTEEIKKLLEEN